MSKLYDLLYTMIGKLNSSVKTTAQTLTDAEKTQARTNIGAQPAGDYAKKTDIPTVPTKVSAFTNDAGYLTQHQDLSAYAKKTEIPSKLPNPHALTINGKTYDGSSAVSVTVEGGSGGGGADWNAAEGEPGHVKHRTHWIDVDIVEILPETQAKIQSSQYDKALSFVPMLEVKQGDIITVAINGMEYKCAAQLWQNNMYVFGDGNYFGFGNSGAGEPFCVLYMAGSNSGVYVKQDCTISIYKDNSIIHKLDKKFLPDALQFGDEEVYILPETEVAFVADADMDGMAVATFAITDIPAEGTTCIVTFAGVEYESTVMNMGGNQLYIGNNAMLDGTDTGEPYAIVMATDDTGAVGPAVAISLIGETTASVSIKGTRTVPIASRYAPKPVYIDLYALGLTASTDSLVSIDLDDGTKASIKAQLDTAAKSGIVRVKLSYALTHANFFFPDSDATERAGDIGALNMLISGSLGHYKMHCVVLDNIICVEYNSGELRAIARRLTLT